MLKKIVCLLLLQLIGMESFSQSRPRDLGITIGVLPTGPKNALTDVTDVRVGHLTKIEGQTVRTGVTAILPHGGNLFQEKIPAAIFIGNGFGKLAGVTQVEELGNLESPIILTNTMNVATGIDAVLTFTLAQEGNEQVQSVNAVVGETNDGYLNDIRGRHVTTEDVLQAIAAASNENIEEGNIGAGTGTVCFGFKGGIGTSSRKLPESLGGYTVGVLVQTNFGGVLEINGVPIGKELNQYTFRNQLESADGSCMIIVATDAPVGERNLKRMAQRAMMGLAKTGGIASNGSGDYVIAFSSNPDNRISHSASPLQIENLKQLRNDDMTGLFLATIEATEEAIVNSLFAANTMVGVENRKIEALPIDQVMALMKKYGKL